MSCGPLRLLHRALTCHVDVAKPLGRIVGAKPFGWVVGGQGFLPRRRRRVETRKCSNFLVCGSSDINTPENDLHVA